MPVTLTKGQSVNLTKEAPGLTDVMLGAGWDMAAGGGKVDLDLSIFALDINNKCRSSDDFIYFGHQKNTAKTLESSGDNRTGAGDGDDETIDAKLAKLDPAIIKLVVVLTRYDSGHVKMGAVDNAFIRAVNKTDGKELARFEVKGDANAKSLMFGELSRVAEGWQFTAVGTYGPDTLETLAEKYNAA